MNDTNRNTRTLIVSFVVAIMALIPLRFIEVGQQLGEQQYVQVLGTDISREVVLPNAEIVAESVLEAPFAEMESQAVLGEVGGVSCVSQAEAEKTLTIMRDRVAVGDLDREQLDYAVQRMVEVENSICR